MSLTSPYSEIYYVGNGSTTQFAFGQSFEAPAEANVKCIIYFDEGTSCVPTFTVDTTTGYITIVTLTKPDGTVLTAPPEGSVVRIFRDTPEQQNVTASQLQNYTAKQLEKIFDSIVAMVQENAYDTQHKTIRSTETQRDISLQKLTEEEDQALLYWDEETSSLKATSYGQDELIAAVERANNVADEAKGIAQTTQGNLTSHVQNLTNPHQTSLVNLTDTDIVNPVNGQFVMFDGLKWKNVYSSAIASWGTLIGDITTQSDLMDKFTEYVRTDGTSIMTQPLLMRATDDFKCAIAPYWDGIGFFKLNDNNSVSLMASIEYNSGFEPATTNTYNIGASARKWKNLYLAGKAYMSVINNGYDIAIPVTNSADTFALLSDIAFKSADVELTTPASGQFLMYDGSKWINSTQGYANTDLSNLTSAGKNISNWSSNVSNCITEIPQDIKLELNNGTLTLKAGSKVYVPNGSGVFDEVTIDSDLTIPAWENAAQGMLSIKPSTFDIWISLKNQQYSGGTPPTDSLYELWYDTDNNKVRTSSDIGSTWADGYSLPIALITSNGSSWTSIDQVFNGFGYIGLTIFGLPGVKCLIPNGRNADGTCNNIEITLSSVQTTLESSNRNRNRALLAINSSGNLERPNTIWGTVNRLQDLPKEANSCWYCVEDNKIHYFNNYSVESIVSYVFVGSFSTTGYSSFGSKSKITYFDKKVAFQAVDYSDSDFIANCAMPSDNYIDLTLGTTGSTYTAPADGYFTWQVETTADNQFFGMENTTAGHVQAIQWVPTYGGGCHGFIPAKKGDICSVGYTASNVVLFRFVYAKGAQ